MIDWQPYLKGKVSIWCSTHSEYLALLQLATADDIPLINHCQFGGAAYCIVDNAPKWCHIKNWLASHGYSEVEMSFDDFISVASVDVASFEYSDFVTMLMDSV